MQPCISSLLLVLVHCTREVLVLVHCIPTGTALPGALHTLHSMQHLALLLHSTEAQNTASTQ
jgi:hypothetical protein